MCIVAISNGTQFATGQPVTGQQSAAASQQDTRQQSSAEQQSTNGQPSDLSHAEILQVDQGASLRAVESEQGARPAIKVTPTADGSFVIDTEGRLRTQKSFGEQYRLLKINGVCVKGRTPREVERMLAGTPGSNVDLTLLLIIYGELSVETLTRETPEARAVTAPNPAPVVSGLNILQIARYGEINRRNRMFTPQHSAISAVAEGNRLIAAACYTDLLDGQPMVHPKISSSETNIELPDMLQFFYDNALFAKSDRVVERCLELSKSPSKLSNEELAALLKAILIMSRTGHESQAARIIAALSSSYKAMSIDNQALFSDCTSSNIGKSSKSTDDLHQEIERKRENWDPQLDNDPFKRQLDPLQAAASYYFKAGQYERASNCYEKLAKRQTPSVQTKYTSQGCVFMIFPPLISTRRSQAQCYVATSDFSQAIKTLRAAIETCRFHMNEEQQLLLEQSTSPGLSDLKFDLATTLLKANETKQAHDLLVESIHELEDSVGAESPALDKTLACLRNVDESLHLPEEAKALTKRLNALDRSHPQHSGSDESSSAPEPAAKVMAKKTYAAILAHDYPEAERLIKGLIELELSHEPLGDEQVAAILNLIKAYGQTAPRESHRALLRSLDPLFSGPGPASTNRIFQLTEIALASGSAENQSSHAWQLLREALRTAERAQFQNRNINVAADATLNWETTRHLQALASAYACNEEPASAVRIMEFATHATETQSAIDSLLWLASFQAEDGKFAAAQETIDAALSRDVNGSPGIDEPLIAIATTLEAKGRKQAAEKILVSGVAYKEKHAIRGIDHQLESCLAELRQRQGRKEEALKIIDQSREGGGVDDQYRKAELLAEVHEYEKALDLYLNQLCTNIRDPLGMKALGTALKLLNERTSVDTITISKFVACLSNMYPGKATEEESNLLERALTFLTAHQAPEKDIRRVKARLATTYGALNKREQSEKIFTALAEQAEKEEPGTGSEFWQDTARSVLSHKEYDKACELMLHAMSLPGAKDHVSMYHPGNIRSDLGIAAYIAADRHDLAEKILRKAIELRASRTAEPREPAFERALLAEVLIDAGKYKDAWVVLNELLSSIDKPNGNLCRDCDRPSNGLCECLYGLVDEFLLKLQVADAERLAHLTVNMQKKWLGSKNPQFVDTLRRLGNAQRLANEREAASDTLKKSLDIACWNYGPGSRSVSFSRIDYAGSLIALGKREEAEKVASCHPEQVERPNSQLLYGRRLGFHTRTPEHFANTAEGPLREQFTESRRVTGDGSRETEDARRKLIQFFKERQDFPEAQKIQQDALAICELKEGKCSRARRGWLIGLAQTSLARNDKKQALAWLAKAETVEHNPGDWMDEMHDSIQYASLLLYLGRKAEALKVADPTFKKFEDKTTMWAPPEKTLDECINFAEAAGLVKEEQLAKDLKEKTSRRRFSM